MKKWIFIVALGLTVSPALQAQQLVERQGFEKKVSSFKFESSTHDFGDVPEDGGPVRYRFEFTNTGEVPVKVLEVKASCGCTTPEWSRDEIMPGQTGFVVAEYNPQNRPGQFHKTLTVNTNAEPNVSILNIKGVVKPKPRTIEDDYPNEMGKLRLKYRNFNMGKVTTEKPAVKKFEVYNQGDKPLVFNKKNVEAPEYINIAFEPQTLPANGRGNIIITYDAAAKGDLGWVTDNVAILTNEAEGENRKGFTVSITIEEYFPPMTESELAKAPRLQVDRSTHEWGNVRQGNTVETEFVLTNNGHSELIIRDTKANCGCTVSTPEKTTLLPGESAPMKVSFNTEGRKGTQYKTVTIFSNDPTAPTQTLTLKAHVND
ncbi:hypothetical protein D770_26245 [Flammeovirgaceae bacterium 311]|nr:hypothetical protein D770_26245 [Flammeovirgaceae bacterium 311]